MSAKTQSLADQAYVRLKWLILSQELPAGTLLNENALVESTGFGRAAIHHSLHRLAYDDLVVIRPRKGVQVRLWSERDAIQLVEARQPVERTIVRLACERVTNSDVEQMHERIQETPGLIESLDREGLLRLDLWFHAAIAAATRNEILADTALRLHQRSTHFWALTFSGRDRYHSVYLQHLEIVRALGRRDAEAADAAILNHISNLQRPNHE